MNKKLLETKLRILKEFQLKYPTSHVGGSIGLMLRGINLERDLSKSDLDITIHEYIKDNEHQIFEYTQSGNDFDYRININDTLSNHYAKIDIRVNPEPSFDIVIYEGIEYNVSLLRNIIFWKKKYSDKGVRKHYNDLITMGVIKEKSVPLSIKTEECNESDLPF